MSKEKGELYYKSEDVAASYDDKRFTGQGGRYIVQKEYEAYLELLGDVSGLKVLDVATGTGRLALQLAEHGADVTACDISSAMINEAREKDKHGRVDWCVADAENLPFDDDEFDVVVSQRFLHLVEDHEPFVDEMVRVARDRVMYDYFNKWSLRLLYDGLLPMGSYLHSPSEVNEMLEGKGLSVDETRRLVLPYGAIRGRSGPHIRLATGLDELLTGVTDKLNSIVFVEAEL